MFKMIFVRVKLTLEIDDDTGSGLFRAFDHVMLTVAVVNSTSQVSVQLLLQFTVCWLLLRWMFDNLQILQGSSRNAFNEVLGKSIMFIVRKDRHEPNFVGTTYEVLRVADSPSILNYLMEKGNCIVPSKVILILICLLFILFLIVYYLFCWSISISICYRL
jgi:hypothetical protein